MYDFDKKIVLNKLESLDDSLMNTHTDISPHIVWNFMYKHLKEIPICLEMLKDIKMFWCCQLVCFFQLN